MVSGFAIVASRPHGAKRHAAPPAGWRRAQLDLDRSTCEIRACGIRSVLLDQSLFRPSRAAPNPVLLRFAHTAGAAGFNFDPLLDAARAVRSTEPLRRDAFAAAFAGALHDVAVALIILLERERGCGPRTSFADVGLRCWQLAQFDRAASGGYTDLLPVFWTEARPKTQ